MSAPYTDLDKHKLYVALSKSGVKMECWPGWRDQYLSVYGLERTLHILERALRKKLEQVNAFSAESNDL